MLLQSALKSMNQRGTLPYMLAALPVPLRPLSL